MVHISVGSGSDDLDNPGHSGHFFTGSSRSHPPIRDRSHEINSIAFSQATERVDLACELPADHFPQKLIYSNRKSSTVIAVTVLSR